MEHYGVWKGRDVYTITHAEYVRHKYYEPDVSSAFWITDDNYFVADNRIVGKVVRDLTGRITIDDGVKIAGSRYYYAVWAEKERVEEALKEKIYTAELSSAEEILASVYTAKLWDEI